MNNEVAGSGLWEAKLPEEDNDQSGPVFEVIAAENGAESDGSDHELVIGQQVQQHEEEAER